MTKSVLSKLMQSCGSVLSGMERTRSLLYRKIHDGMLTGLLFEGSSFDADSFQVTYFASTVAYPLDSVVLDLPNRLRNRNGGDRWNTRDPNVESELSEAVASQAVLFLDQMRRPSAFAATLRERNETVQILRAEVIAFARAGEENDVQATIAKLQSVLDPRLPWQVEIQKNISVLQAEMELSPIALGGLLDRWERETCERLQLKRSSM
jgi:hypothetical protein